MKTVILFITGLAGTLFLPTTGLLAQQMSGQQQNPQMQQGISIHLSQNDIHQIEETLSRRGFNVGNVDGVWDQQLSRAIRDFQQQHGLQSTGQLNFPTLRDLAIAAEPGGPRQSAALQRQRQYGQQPPTPQVMVPAEGWTVYIPINPPDIAEVQQRLGQAGSNPGDITGTIDRKTVQALTHFQRTHGLQPTGRIDLSTLQALGMAPHQFIAVSPSGHRVVAEQMFPREPAQEGLRMPSGSEGTASVNRNAMRQVQSRLSHLGYEPGNLVGIYDVQTAQAISQFQQAQGLQATGQLNQQTVQALGFNPQQFYGIAPEFGQQQKAIQQPGGGQQQGPTQQPGGGQ